MKTKWLLFFIFLAGFGFSQNYDPLINPSKIWTDLILSACGHQGESYRYKIGDSVMINDLHYLELLRCADSIDAEWTANGYIRETEDSLVFYRGSMETAEKQIYDFSLNKGDTVFFIPSQWQSYVVDSVYFKNFAGINRKHLLLNSYNIKDSVEYPQDLWIEGIGSVYGLLSTPYLGWVGVYRFLLCFEQDGQLLYHFNQLPYGLTIADCFFTGIEDSPKFGKLNLFPNPVGHNMEVELKGYSRFPCEIEIYNSLGQVCKKICLQGPQSKINLHGLDPGLYTCRVVSEKNLPQLKLIVQ